MKTPQSVAVVLAASAMLLVACGGGGGSSSPAAPSETTQAAAGALTASKPGELLAFIKDKLRERQKQRLLYPEVSLPVFATIGVTTASDSAAPASSGTTLQEQGVDEEDLLKTDGFTLVALSTQPLSGTVSRMAQLQLHQRLASGKLQATGTLDLLNTAGTFNILRGMYFAPEAAGVVVLSQGGAVQGDFKPCIEFQPCIVPSLVPARVNLQWVDISKPAAPAVVQRITVDGRYVGSRQIGNLLVLVATHGPTLAVDLLPSSATDAQREAELIKLSAADVLPMVSVNGGAAQALLADTDCYLQAKNTSLAVEITSITVFDLKSATLARTSRCFVGGTETLYMSPSSIYLATTRYAALPVQAQVQSFIRFPAQASTDVHKFSLAGQVATYKGSGEVLGHLGWDASRKPYRMSEYLGDLRVLSFTGEVGWSSNTDAVAKSIAPSPATLTVLRERSSDLSLQMVGQLPNAKRPAPLGLPGEQVYGVRLLGDKGYVVTFRQTDPLYVLDLSDPIDPRAVGELKIPGFSDYLFPIEGGLLFGVGRDASAEGRLGGLKVALFDVQNPAAPKELATQIYGERGSTSGLDYSSHGVNMLMRNGVMRIALPVYLRQGGTAVVQGLQRWEVDTRTRSLQARPMIAAASLSGDLYSERSVQINDNIYYLTQGRLGAFDW